jgi:Secretion system C-terminal sorting domain
MKQLPILIIVLILSLNLKAQYPPAAGIPGTTAIHKDSLIFVQWADSCVITRGFVNIADSSFEHSSNNHASYGNNAAALGMADNDVLSLGDAGVATYYFQNTLCNGYGFDFAIFENALTDNFLELAFVEISSNGIDFYRFPTHSLTQDSIQIGTYGTVEPTNINGFAGKYKTYYGTPFDIADLDTVANLDVMNIVAVRIVDVVGSIDTAQSYDSYGNIVNNMFPTPFNSSGFDLDALGIIHNNVCSSGINDKMDFKMYPNPSSKKLYLQMEELLETTIKITTINGALIFEEKNTSSFISIDVSFFSTGIYLVQLTNNNNFCIKKFIKN